MRDGENRAANLNNAIHSIEFQKGVALKCSATAESAVDGCCCSSSKRNPTFSLSSGTMYAKKNPDIFLSNDNFLHLASVGKVSLSVYLSKSASYFRSAFVSPKTILSSIVDGERGGNGRSRRAFDNTAFSAHSPSSRLSTTATHTVFAAFY